MNVTVEARRAAGLCADCGNLMRQQEGKRTLRCSQCRRKRVEDERRRALRIKEAEYLCLGCGAPIRSDNLSMKCLGCRRGAADEAEPTDSPYRGLRPCSQHLSANCLHTFMSPDKRAIHCCPPCRHAQLLASADWAGE